MCMSWLKIGHSLFFFLTLLCVDPVLYRYPSPKTFILPRVFMMGNLFCKIFGSLLMDWLHLCKLENKWLMSRVVQVCTQTWIFVRKAPFVCLWNMKGCVGGRTNHRIRWVGRDPWRSGIWLCSKACNDGTVVRQAGALVRHQFPMVNGEFGLPGMSLLRCPSEGLLKPCTTRTEIVPRNNSVLLSSGGGLFWQSPSSLFLSSTLPLAQVGVVGALTKLSQGLSSTDSRRNWFGPVYSTESPSF